MKKNKSITSIRGIFTCIPAVLWMALILTFSSFQGGGKDIKVISWVIGLFESIGLNLYSWWGEYTPLIVRKCGHMFEYLILFLLLLIPVRYIGKKDLHAVIIAVIFASADELFQSFIPNRHGTLTDVLIDSIPIILCWGLIALYRAYRVIF